MGYLNLDTFITEGLYNCVSLRETSPLLFHSHLQSLMKQEDPIDFLVTIYEDFLSKHNLPEYDASDMLHAHFIEEITLEDGQIGWLKNFIRLWDFVSEAEYQNWKVAA